jgi:hypothetical protein
MGCTPKLTIGREVSGLVSDGESLLTKSGNRSEEGN